MSDDLGFAIPPFDPGEALQKLKRELRALGLTERQGASEQERVFERRSSAIARARIDNGAIAAARVRKPSRSSPEWQTKALRSSADVRDFVNDLKKQLAQWSDRDD
jgi:hypothetical protein